ncbi:MAG: 2-C-methyl-D-erythritol 4-phosphate cytidylyltransferase, partial [Chlamydiota bacterium]
MNRQADSASAMLTSMHPIDKSTSAAILLLGGTGTRFGSDLPKQFHRLCGKKVYLHTLEKLIDSGLFGTIVLVCPKQWMCEVKKDTASHPELLIVEGGSSRQESSFKGLLALPENTQTVLIHDAVRPFVSRAILSENVTGAKQFHAVDTCIPSTDTLVHAPDQKTITSIPNRSELLRGQTPQSFSYPLILKAHQQALIDGIHNASDDCSLVLRLGHPIHVIQGSERNMKITTELDILLAEQLFRMGENHLAETHAKLPLSGKTFAITGGMGDIGRAIAHLLQQEGARAIPISRSSPHYPADLSSFSSTQNAFDQIQREFGPLDGLINSVGLLQI